jgi:hypothetical protein
MHIPIVCDDGNPCTIDQCVNGACQYTPMNCDDGDPCTEDSCVNSECQHVTIPGCGNLPPEANCDNTVYAFINILDPDYNGPGLKDVHLIPIEYFDQGSSSSSGWPVMEVKRMNSFINFEWTKLGACIDVTNNYIMNDPDKGKPYRACLPVTPADIFQWKPYKFRISDEYGSDECSGYYMIIPYFGGWNMQGTPLPKDLTDERLLLEKIINGQIDIPDDVPVNISRQMDWQVYPNPGDEEVYVNWESPAPEPVVVQLLDITGKSISNKTQMAQPGRNTLVLDTRHVDSGTYIVHMKSLYTVKAVIWIKTNH